VRASVLAVGIAMGAALAGSAVAQTNDVKPQLLDLTGGRRVKVVWNQGSQDKTALRLYDTQDGKVRDLPFAGSAPLLTPDGRLVLASTGKAPDERRVAMYDTETGKVTEFPKGPGNNLLAVWQDPKSGRVWVYVNDSGDKNESWNVPAGKIYRFSTDKPDARELFWDRTSSHIYLMFSADGTRACFEPSWSNIGQLKIVCDAEGKVDQDKSVYKRLAGGCFPSMAPDNSYRLFALEGDHHAITMLDADGANPRKVPVSDMPGVREKGKNVWLTRWSTHPRYLTLVAPAGSDAGIWLGRFDETFTKVETWVRVTEPGPQCWQSQAWVEPEKQ
jgi:sugar lactone lactonase YvrE